MGTLKADLHVHSIHSERPSEWILKTLGTRESYTDPELIFQTAKERGMDLVTITDHNRLDGALLLKERYPEQVFTGVEATSYFPENRSKIHVLVYGLEEHHLTEINRIRNDLFDLREYPLQEDLAHSIAHATFSVNRRLVYEDLERLILMFNVFEVINGNCTYIHNHTWYVRLKPGVELIQSIEKIYEAIATFSDEFFRATLESITRDFKKLDIINLLRKVSSSLFGVFMILPFVTTMKHMFQDRRILEKLEEEFLPHVKCREKRILWFTDTISNLNGVSVTLKKIGWLAKRKNKDLTLVSCLLENEINADLPPNLRLLPHMFDFTPRFYDVLTIKIPSILKSLKIIFDLKPEEIIISTPGPVGLIGVLTAKLMSVKLKVIYDSDFTKQIGSIIQDEYTSPVIDAYQRWFHKLTGLKQGVTLLYAGRIARDKNLDFLRCLYLRLQKRFPELNLVLAGDGPYLQEYRSSFNGEKRVCFTGLLDQKILPYVYSGADLFVFPSTIDTFGMVVLEAQACGLPAVVSDVGGPQEIIDDGTTGRVALAEDPDDWERKVGDLIDAAAGKTPAYQQMRGRAVARVQERFDWEQLLDDLFAKREHGIAFTTAPRDV